MNSKGQVNYIFIIGVIYGLTSKKHRCVEAVKLHDTKTKESDIVSLNVVGERIKRGEPIVGARFKNLVTYNEKRRDFINNETVYLDIMHYDHRQMSELNGAGEVIKKGKEIIIGMKEIDGVEKCVVMDADCNIRYVDKETAVKEKLLGVIRKSFLKESRMLIDI